jgi:glycosyltransferase involved in cell wall biosynthesis
VFAHYFTLAALRREHPGRYRTIWHLHNFLNEQRHLGLPARFNRLQARRGADWLLGVSHAVTRGWGRSGVPARVIHNCVPSRGGESAPARRVPSRGGDEPLRLVACGRLEWSKGLHVAIRAVARLHEEGVRVTLDIFGGPLVDNPYVDRLRQRVTAHGLSGVVSFHGYVGDLASRIVDYDIALQCRIDPEPCSLYVLECMHAGVPLVASGGGGTPELVVDGASGCLYQPGDADALAACVSALARDPARREQYARCARARAQTRFSHRRFADRLADFYREVARPLVDRATGRTRREPRSIATATTASTSNPW